jgi:uncharacterized SAM-binding protein YcdF (DUF218 family)
MDAATPPPETEKPRRRRGARAAAGLALGLAAAAALLFLCRLPILVGAARLLTLDDPEIPADYLVVLGGGLETRPFTAAELYRRGLAPAALLFEHAQDPAAEGPGADELHRRVLTLGGVPPRAVLTLPGPVASTEDEARALRRFLGARPAGRVTLVTSPEHGRRAKWIFRRTLSGLPVEIYVANAPHPLFDESNWWRSDQGVLAYLHEYLKLPVYLVRTLFRKEPSPEMLPSSPVPSAGPSGGMR